MSTTLITTEEQLEEFSGEIAKATSGAIDIETTIPDDHGNADLITIGCTFDGKRAWVMPFTHPELVGIPPGLVNNYFKLVDPYWKTVEWIMHNGAFDRAMLHKFGIDAPLKHDTMAMAYLLDPDARKSLEVLSKEYLGLDAYKGVDYKKIMEEPLEKIAEMNGEDALRTFNLKTVLGGKLNEEKNEDLRRVYNLILMPAINALIEITENGVPLDMERLVTLSETVSSKADELRSVLSSRAAQLGLADYNPNSSQQTAKMLYEIYELPVIKLTATDKPSTDAETRMLLATTAPSVPGGPRDFLALLDAYKTAITGSRHVANWMKFEVDGKVHPKYKPLFTSTGRLSSAEPNIQNVPRDPAYRRVFGGQGVWVKADYSQIELRIAAHLSGERKMLEAYNTGQDLHQLTASLVLGETGPEARQYGKTLNFGLLYGGGPGVLVRTARDYGVSITIDEAKKLRKKFLASFPLLEDWQSSVFGSVERTGKSVSPLGRVRYLPEATYGGQVDYLLGKKYHALRQGLNHPVQSFASDILLMSVVRLRESGFGPYMVAEVHDEIDFVMDEQLAYANLTIEQIQATMEDTTWLERFGIKLDVPLVADVEVGTHWSNDD